ncbi:uncharacterized protein LOC119662931 [Teleopsis dalmanni]|uniref:uncharacterized protein LOC119662931 n=1 Tax=Teleopsis dalmanni TaxID=139649 RepID=UPI0018CC9F8E|nr:uncharacterized protein LOC119662931 [Teleopsis dalmanni]
MQHLKPSFISTMESKKTTDAGLTTDMRERSITGNKFNAFLKCASIIMITFAEHVLKICPKFDLLYDIFGNRSNVNVNIVKSDASVECLINPSATEVEPIAMPTNVGNETDSASALEDSPTSSRLSRTRGINRNRSSSAQRETTFFIIMLQQRRIEIEVQKIKILKENADLDRAQALRVKKMELEAYKEVSSKNMK